MYNSNAGSEFITGKEICLFESFPLHDHTGSLGYGAMELCYVIEGEAVNVINGERQRIKTGDYILIDYGVSHSIELCEGKRIRLYNFLFDYRIFDIAMKGAVSLSDIAYRYGINRNGKNLDARTDFLFKDKNGEIKKKLKTAKRELLEKKSGYHEMARCAFVSVVLTAFRHYFGCERSTKIYSKFVKDVVNRVNTEYMREITLSEIANSLGQKLAALSLSFKRETGMTFTEFLHKRRTDEGCRLLLSTDYSIEQISEIVGYSDSKKFREWFNRIEGISPREYRRRMRFG